MSCVYQELKQRVRLAALASAPSPELAVVGDAWSPCPGWVMLVDAPD